MIIFHTICFKCFPIIKTMLIIFITNFPIIECIIALIFEGLPFFECFRAIQVALSEKSFFLSKNLIH